VCNPATEVVISKQHLVSVNTSGQIDFKPIQVTGCVRFEGGAVIWGGITLKDAFVTFDEGMYVFAGALPDRGDAGVLFTTDDTSDVVLRDSQAISGTRNKGELFIFTDGNYRGMATDSSVTPQQIIDANPNSFLKQGTVGLKTGTAGKVQIKLTGVDNNQTGVSSDMPDLPNHQGLLFWFDRRNSYVEYTGDGLTAPATIGCSGNSAASCPNADLSGDNVYANSPEFFFEASNNASLTGIIYQPRGAWAKIDASSNYAGPLQLITGAINMQGSGVLNLGVPTLPFVRRTVSLVE
jgi:hypothetical protein